MTSGDGSPRFIGTGAGSPKRNGRVSAKGQAAALTAKGTVKGPGLAAAR